jgi:hypothetical protein
MQTKIKGRNDMIKFKYLLSVLAGAVAAYFEQYIVLYGLLFAAVILDLATGCVASAVTGEGLNSSKAFKGVLKKAALFVALGFGTFLDVFLPFAAEKIGLTLPDMLIFSAVICVYIVLCECISVCENLYRCSENILPKWVVKLLGLAKDQIDNMGEQK